MEANCAAPNLSAIRRSTLGRGNGKNQCEQPTARICNIKRQHFSGDMPIVPH